MVGVIAEGDATSTQSDASESAPGNPEDTCTCVVGFADVACAVMKVRPLAALALLTSRSRPGSCVSLPSALSIRSRSGSGRAASSKASSVRVGPEGRRRPLREHSDPWRLPWQLPSKRRRDFQLPLSPHGLAARRWPPGTVGGPASARGALRAPRAPSVPLPSLPKASWRSLGS